jgi:hypothetical protein
MNAIFVAQREKLLELSNSTMKLPKKLAFLFSLNLKVKTSSQQLTKIEF